MSDNRYDQLRAELLRLEAAGQAAFTADVGEISRLLADYDHLHSELQRLRGLVRAQSRPASGMSSKLKEALRE
ncbi:hypothetical protein B5M42_001820 [Paenibacillus athensensis]|uniref:Uncharacterized protein n=1 Tax=Paenibacillus athensensis TaxID=1967502 RepID=A0A4Y8QAQ6_9BACL|nr:hypothetical protein [Paenibacillus athensensis]MCD1257574.1 hypothetical protein [Paenibacillus athensensis]